jgi:hypothetical protein
MKILRILGWFCAIIILVLISGCAEITARWLRRSENWADNLLWRLGA